MAAAPETPRFFANDSNEVHQIPDEDSAAELVKILDNIVTNYAPKDVWSDVGGQGVGGIYCGPTGIAYVRRK